MEKIKNVLRFDHCLGLLLGLFVLGNVSETVASQLVRPLPIRKRDTISLKTKELIKPAIETMKTSTTEEIIERVKAATNLAREEEKKQNIPSMFSRITKDPSIMEKARKSRELVMKNPMLRREIISPSKLTMDIDTMLSSQVSLPLVKEKIRNYTLKEIVDGINYLRFHNTSGDAINLFAAELTFRGYPYDIKGYENKKICENLSPDIQKLLYVEHAISSLKDRIIDKYAERRKKLAFHLRGFSFNSVAFSPNGDQLVIAGVDGQNNSQLVLFDCNNDGTFTFKGVIDREVYINSVVFSPDGKIIAVARNDGWFDLVTPNSGSDGPDFSTHSMKIGNKPLLSVAFRPNGRQIILLTKDALVTCAMKDSDGIDPSYVINRAQPEDKNFKVFAVSSDGKQIAVGTSSGRIIIYSFDSNRIKHWDFPDRSINVLTFTPDNMKLVSGQECGGKNKLVFSKPETNKMISNRFDNYSVSALAFIPGLINKIIIQTYGNQAFPKLVLANISEFDSRSGGIEVGDLYSPSGGIKFKNLDSPDHGISMTVSPNGEKIAVGFKGKLIVWDLLNAQDKEMLNGLRNTLTKDQAGLISILTRQLNKNDPIKLLPFERDDYHELPFAVRDLLLGAHIAEYAQ